MEFGWGSLCKTLRTVRLPTRESEDLNERLKESWMISKGCEDTVHDQVG